jgi:uncharacterized protein YbaP (TraB family)
MGGPASRPFRARPLALFLALVLLALMGWLGWQIGRMMATPESTARPALWRISQGDRQAYLFGTIHAVPRGEVWLSPQIERAMGRSDRLLLEVTGLDTERRSRATFEKLGRSPRLPPVETRLSESDAAHYRTLRGRHASLHGLDRYESWAAALLLNAAASSNLDLSPADAGESVFAERFARQRKPIQGLETIQGQLGLFDRLTERDQRLLLAQAVREADDAPRLYTQLHDAWARGDVARLERQFLAPLAAAPGLRRVLIDDRNRRWADVIDADLKRQGGILFVAVGAGHLLGKGSVQDRLAERGWHVERIQ